MMARLFLILLIFSLSPAVTSASDNMILSSDTIDIHASDDEVAVSRSFDYFYHHALLLKEQERYDEAFYAFQHCLRLQPGAPVVLCELYAMYSFLGLKEMAVKMVEQAVEGNPDNFWYYQLLASAYEYDGMKQAAMAVYEKITAKFPSHSEMFYKLAMMYADEGMYENAIKALDALERIDGKTEDITLQKFRIYCLMNNKEEAINVLHELIAEYPEELRLKVFLGDNHMTFGDTAIAYSIYQDVLQTDPDNAYAQLSVAEYYRAIGNDTLFTHSMENLLMNRKFTGEERAAALVRYVSYKERQDTANYNIKFFERLMQLPYEQALTSEIYANYLTSKGVGEDSVAPVLQRLLQYEPENRYAHLQLLDYAIKREAIDEIISRCDTAILYHPEILELYYYRGMGYYKKENYSAAISSFKTGLDAREEGYDAGFISDIYALIGDAYHVLGNMDACVQAYDSALVYNDENIAVYNNYAYYLVLDGRDFERAEEMSYRTIKEEPENTVYIDTYMWVLFALERYDEAKAYAEKLLSIEKDPGVVELHHCGDIFAKSGDMERAVEFWKKARDKGDNSKTLNKKIKRRKYIPNDKKK